MSVKLVVLKRRHLCVSVNSRDVLWLMEKKHLIRLANASIWIAQGQMLRVRNWSRLLCCCSYIYASIFLYYSIVTLLDVPSVMRLFSGMLGVFQYFAITLHRYCAINIAWNYVDFIYPMNFRLNKVYFYLQSRSNGLFDFWMHLGRAALTFYGLCFIYYSETRGDFPKS